MPDALRPPRHQKRRNALRRQSRQIASRSKGRASVGGSQAVRGDDLVGVDGAVAQAHLLALQRAAGNGSVNELIAPFASVQRVDPKADDATKHRDELDAEYQKAFGKDWQRTAVLLNGFDDDDIRARVGFLGFDDLYYLKLGALQAMPGWSDRVTKPVDANDPEAGRVAQLKFDYDEAVGKDWNKAASLLNAYNDDDIRDKLKALSAADLESMKAGALASMPGWSARVVKPIYALLYPHDFPFAAAQIQAVWDENEKAGNPGSKNQIDALSRLDTTRAGPWTKLSWATVAGGTAARVYHPELISQVVLGVCGSAASLNAEAAVAALDYVNEVAGVFETGEAAGSKVNSELLDTEPNPGLDQSDWMMLTAMQDVGNYIAEYHGETESWRAGLNDSQIAWSIEHFSGCVKSKNYSCSWWGEVDTTKTVNELMSKYGDKVVVIMIVSGAVLKRQVGMEGGAESGPANHAIRMLAPVTFDGSSATISVFTWGTNYTLTMPLKRYEKLIDGFIVGARDASVMFP